MALCIRERIFSWKEAYDVTDENQKPLYYVKGEFFALGHKIHIYNEKHEEVAFIKEKVFSFLHKFEIYLNGELKGTVKEKFSWFHPEYQIDFLNAEITGDIFAWNYQILQNKEPIGVICRKILSWANVYYLEIPDKKNELAILALSIAVDAAHNDDEDAAMASVYCH